MLALAAPPALAAPAARSAPAEAAPPLPGLHLTFSETFTRFRVSADGPGWMSRGAQGWRTLGSNHEAQFYSDASVGIDPFRVQDGILTITAAPGPNPQGLPFVSGLLNSLRLHTQLYGYFEITARLPAGRGLWPAFWLLPADLSWPPEIDVFEQLGNDPTTIFVGTHSSAGGRSAVPVRVGNTAAGFHVYAVDWQADRIAWYFDGRQIFTEPTPGDLHQPLYMIVNLAVGGIGSWPGPPDATTPMPAELRVRRIRVFGR